MADLDRRIDRVGRGTRHDRAVVEQHRCRAVMIVVVETVADQRPARVHRRQEIALIHERDLTEMTCGGQPMATPKGGGRRGMTLQASITI